jgi:hypothetical protein
MPTKVFDRRRKSCLVFRPLPCRRACQRIAIRGIGSFVPFSRPRLAGVERQEEVGRSLPTGPADRPKRAIWAWRAAPVRRILVSTGPITKGRGYRMKWSESRPQGDYYTLFELRCDGDLSHKALAEFWRGILTDGRRLAAGWDWGWLVFRVSTDAIWAWFSETTIHSRRVPVLFALACPAIEREYDRLPHVDGDVTEAALDQYFATYGRHIVRAARTKPVPGLLADWRRERPIRVELEVYDGWTPLEVGVAET